MFRKRFEKGIFTSSYTCVECKEEGITAEEWGVSCLECRNLMCDDCHDTLWYEWIYALELDPLDYIKEETHRRVCCTACYIIMTITNPTRKTRHKGCASMFKNKPRFLRV